MLCHQRMQSTANKPHLFCDSMRLTHHPTANALFLFTGMNRQGLDDHLLEAGVLDVRVRKTKPRCVSGWVLRHQNKFWHKLLLHWGVQLLKILKGERRVGEIVCEGAP